MIQLFANFEMVINVMALIILIICVWKGYKDGFALSLYDLVSFVLILFIAYSVAISLASVLPLVPQSVLTQLTIANNELLDMMINVALFYLINLLVWFLILFIGLKVLSLLLRQVLKAFKNIPLLGKCNQYLGVFFGIIKTYLLILLMGWVFSLPVFTNGTAKVNASVIAPINNISKEVFTSLNKAYDLSSIIKKSSESMSEFAQLSQEQIDQLIQEAVNLFVEE